MNYWRRGAFERGLMITDGAGLGLYVAKRIIEAHGGTIWVQSQPDKGSTFGVSLPV